MTQSTHSTPSPSSERSREAQRADAALEDPSVARERARERERAEARYQAREHAGHAEPVREEPGQRDELGTSFLGHASTDEHWQAWRQIQANFVDNPRSAVSDAHALVGRLIEDIVHRFEGERNQLEQRWSSGQDVSTEELRRCLQTYRDFFGRLLPNVGGPKS